MPLSIQFIITLKHNSGGFSLNLTSGSQKTLLMKGNLRNHSLGDIRAYNASGIRTEKVKRHQLRRQFCVKNSYSTDHYSFASSILIGLESAKSLSSLQVWPPNLRYDMLVTPPEGSLAIYGSTSAVDKLLTPLGPFLLEVCKADWFRLWSPDKSCPASTSTSETSLRFSSYQLLWISYQEKGGAGMWFIQQEPKQAAREITFEANTIHITVNDVTTVLKDRLSSRIERWNKEWLTYSMRVDLLNPDIGRRLPQA